MAGFKFGDTEVVNTDPSGEVTLVVDNLYAQTVIYSNSYGGPSTTTEFSYPTSVYVGPEPAAMGDSFAFYAYAGGSQSPYPLYTPADNAMQLLEKFPFAISSGTSTDTGEMGYDMPFSPYAWSYRQSAATGHSETTAVISAGFGSPFPAIVYQPAATFPFSITSGTSATLITLPYTASDIGHQLSQGHGATLMSDSSGFIAAARGPSAYTYSDDIFKYPFSITGFSDFSDVGELNTARFHQTNFGDRFEGFIVQGQKIPPAGPPFDLKSVEKFPWSITSGTATSVGDVSETSTSGSPTPVFTDNWTEARGIVDIPSSKGFTFGIRVGGSLNIDSILSFPFSSATSFTDVGEMVTQRLQTGGWQSSSGYGWIGGGFESEAIDKFPFSITSGSSTDTAELNAYQPGINTFSD